MILFSPEAVARTVAAWRAALPDADWAIERKGVFRTIVDVTLEHDGASLRLTPLSSGELSAELRSRRDDVELHDALAAFRVDGAGPVDALVRAVEGWRRETDPSPALRGLALCALVARVQAEDDDYEGIEEEPARLLAWLERHGAAIALSEEERAWLTTPIGSLPLVAQYASLPDRLASHAFALGLVADPESAPLPELMSAFGFLSDALPPGLGTRRIRPGREQFLG